MIFTFAQYAPDMAAKLNTLWPEILLTGVAFLVMLLGLSRRQGLRRSIFWLSIGGLGVATLIAMDNAGGAAPLTQFMKVAIGLIGIALLAVVADLPEEAHGDAPPRPGRPFDPALTMRGEFYGFFLLSLVGAMLCAGADDLIWLFLALELTSLPTYILVAASRPNIRAPEAGIKYFFLGAFSAGIFLYGFALIYAATGTTYLEPIRQTIAADGLSNLALMGVLLSVLGIAFKLAAFPMHFYAADVYEGAATPVSTFLAFVPKAAGIAALILLLDMTGWIGTPNHELLTGVLWIMAVATMFIGNTLALLQRNVKRVLAYSSVAHSGYMLVGFVVGPGPTAMSNGVAAVLLYLVIYGVMTLGAFAVLGILRNGGQEAETFDDLRGLVHRRPGLAAVMAICVLSLAGIPPLAGFFGKLFLISAAISGEFYVLAGLTVLNSAIAAWYYLHIFGVCFLYEPAEATESAPSPARSWAAVGSAAGVIAMSVMITTLMAASLAAVPDARPPEVVRPAGPEVEAATAAVNPLQPPAPQTP